MEKDGRLSKYMKAAGKCPPETEELEKAVDRGFGSAELYLEKKHLDNLENSLTAAKNSDLEIVSVHTPHVSLDDNEYFYTADRLASQLDAYLVFHSQYIPHLHIQELEELNLESDYGYENNPGASRRHLEENILKQGHDLALDTAHLYMADPENYLEIMGGLLETYPEQINLIHLCDSTTTDDGLGFEKGEMDMKRLSKIIGRSGFDGILVLEVMPEHQEDAREKWEAWTE